MTDPNNQILLWGLETIEFIQASRDPSWDKWVEYLTFLGSQYFYMISLPFILFFRSWKEAWLIAAVLLFGLTLNETLKEIISQPRPFVFWPRLGLIPEAGYGLPSGHSSGSLIFFASLALMVKRQFFTILCAFLVLGVSLSRIYLGVHFPSDVLAGWALGLVVLSLYKKWLQDINYHHYTLASLTIIGLTVATALIKGPQKQILMGGSCLLALIFTIRLLEPWPKELSLKLKLTGILIGLILMVGIILGGKTISAELWMVPIRYGLLVFTCLGLYPHIFLKLLKKKNLA